MTTDVFPSACRFRDGNAPIADRVEDLLTRLTPAEKCAQLLHTAPAIERLGIPAYNWWNECLHGIGRAGVATVFPQAIGLAAMWDVPFMRAVADAISTEARAKHHEYLRQGDTGAYAGLTYWSPTINICRDPRWGRGQETYGECPYLTSRLAVAFCKGLQGDDPRYLKVVATPKHYLAHSGPEANRLSFNTKASEKDLRETYMPAFHACVTEAKAESIMGAYNRVNGEVCCGSRKFLQKILREEWGFEGYVVSDCDAIRDFLEQHKITANPVKSAAYGLRNGCDLNCGCAYEKLIQALAKGLITEADIDVAARRLFTARMRLGMFDPPERVPYAQIPYEANDCAAHRRLARDAAARSLVLLKNEGILPLRRDLASIAVIGPNADDGQVLLGNYEGRPSRVVTVLEGIRTAVGAATKVWFAEGCKVTGRRQDWLMDGRLSEAVSAAQRAEVVVLVLGLNAKVEGEQGDTFNPETAAGDKVSLKLPGLQPELLEAVVAVGKPVVVVNLSGSAVDLSWADEHVGAIVQAWYPGEEGGAAVADVLFGAVAPGGRLPVTFYRSLDDLPDFADYSMQGRTYRYFKGEPLYPFGFGLSYARFGYSELTLSRQTLGTDESVEVSVTVANEGAMAGDEVVQLYVSDLEASVRVPSRDLRGLRRLHLAPGEKERVTFTLAPRDFSLIDERGKRILEPGRFLISVGGSQPDALSVRRYGHAPLVSEITVTGEAVELPY
jgi:beta-glucosidase